MAPDLPQATAHSNGANHIISSLAQLQGTLLRGRHSRQGLEWDVIQSKEGTTTHRTPTHQLPGLVPPSTIDDQLHSSPDTQLPPFCSLSRAKYSACLVAHLPITLIACRLPCSFLLPLSLPTIFQRYARSPSTATEPAPPSLGWLQASNDS